MGRSLLERKEKVIMLGDNDPEFAKVVAESTGAAPETAVTETEPALVTEPVAQTPALEENSAFFAEAAPESTESSVPSEPAAIVHPPKPVADLTLEEIARQPKVWPMHVTLKKDHNFPIVMDGRTVGSAEVTAGSRVKVIAVHMEGMNVDFNGNRINVPAEDTDLLTLVNKATSSGQDQTIIASQGE